MLTTSPCSSATSMRAELHSPSMSTRSSRAIPCAVGYSREAQVFLAKVEMKAWHVRPRVECLGDRLQSLRLQQLVLFRSCEMRLSSNLASYPLLILPGRRRGNTCGGWRVPSQPTEKRHARRKNATLLGAGSGGRLRQRTGGRMSAGATLR